MMSLYSIVRIAVAVFLSISLIFFVVRKISVEKSRMVIACIVLGCFGFAGLLHLVPFENAVVSFNTPEDVINYYNNNDILQIIYGKDSCLVVSDGTSSKTAQILMKEDNGWKIRTGFNIKKTDMQAIDSKYLYVMSINDSTDKYVCITSVFDRDINIFDNQGSVFFEASQGHYYGYINDFSNDYVLNIDGDEITFFE